MMYVRLIRHGESAANAGEPTRDHASNKRKCTVRLLKSQRCHKRIAVARVQPHDHRSQDSMPN